MPMKTTPSLLSTPARLAGAALLTIVLGATTALIVPQAFAADAATIEFDSISLIEGKIMASRQGKFFPLEKTARMPFDIRVMTNGTFQVAEGKARPLKQ